MVEAYATDSIPYVLNEYSKKTLADGDILVTARHGGWAILNPHEFRLFRHGKVEEDPELYNTLVQQGLIITDGNADGVASRYGKKHAQVFEGTSLHILTPTLRCNQKCSYCYASSKPAEACEYDMSKDTAKAVVDFIFQCPAKNITIEFQGGEPLLNFPVVKLVVNRALDKANKTGKLMNFNLVSNLTLIDDKKISFIKKNRINLCSSLDGPKELHDKCRRYDSGKGTYEDVVNAVGLLKEKKVSVSLMPTITRHSLPFWKEMVDEYVRLGMDRFWARRLNFTGFAEKSWKDIGYTPAEFFRFWRNSIEYIFKLNQKGTYIEDGLAGILLKNVLFLEYTKFVCLASPCGCAWGQSAYNYKGDIYSCDEARSVEEFRLGNVHSDTYQGLYSSACVMNIVRLTTGESFNCMNCVYHPFCGPCLVDNYGESKNPLRNLGYSCDIRKRTFGYVFKDILRNRERRDIARSWLGIKDKNV